MFLTPNLFLDNFSLFFDNFFLLKNFYLFTISSEVAFIFEHMLKKFKLNRTKIKGGCQLRRKVVTHNAKSDLPLASFGV